MLTGYLWLSPNMLLCNMTKHIYFDPVLFREVLLLIWNKLYKPKSGGHDLFLERISFFLQPFQTSHT